MDGKIALRIVAALVLVAAVAGIAYFAFNAGVARGSPVTIQAPSGETAPMPYPYYGMGYPFHRPFGFGFGFGCFGILIPLFLLFLALKASRMLFWGPRWGHHGPWRRGWGEDGVPAMFQEWHDRAHGKPEAEKKAE